MHRRYIAVLIALWAGAACMEEGPGGEPLGATTRAVSSTNRLTLNRLTLNRLTLNRLTLNRLSMHRVSGSRLVLDTRHSDGLQNTEGGREVLEYLARCALPESVTLTAHDAEGRAHEFAGLLGLAPLWELRGLTQVEEHRLSACLLAHVNAFGAPVQVSMRADGRISASVAEAQDFAVYEATFFGDLFASPDEPLAAYACQGDGGPVARALSADRSLRVCSDDSSWCGITAAGRCRDLCERYVDEYGWQDCTVTLPDGSSRRFVDTISTFLFADDPDQANQRCGRGRSCALAAAAGQAAVLDCSDAASCVTTCGPGGRCLTDGSNSRVRAIARPGSVAQIECQGARSCAASCQDQASCELDCNGSMACAAVQCIGDAGCLLDCTNAGPGGCGYSRCDGPLTYCPGDIIACGRACP